MLPLESWIVISVFIVNLIFFLVMSIVSSYYKRKETFGLGHVFNLVWMLITIIIAGIFLAYNAVCLNKGNCAILSWLIVIMLVGLTIFHFVWGIYKTVVEKKQVKERRV